MLLFSSCQAFRFCWWRELFDGLNISSSELKQGVDCLRGKCQTLVEVAQPMFSSLSLAVVPSESRILEQKNEKHATSYVRVRFLYRLSSKQLRGARSGGAVSRC
uniref:Uncharacterized protein n=1 Tax=Mucochytrium quahogii TaxID=96639 RepID=A0A7S2S9F6_9STRA